MLFRSEQVETVTASGIGPLAKLEIGSYDKIADALVELLLQLGIASLFRCKVYIEAADVSAAAKHEERHEQSQRKQTCSIFLHASIPIKF